MMRLDLIGSLKDLLPSLNDFCFFGAALPAL